MKSCPTHKSQQPINSSTACAEEFTLCLTGRKILDTQTFRVNKNETPAKLTGNGENRDTPESSIAHFNGGLGSYELRINLHQAVEHGNGISISYELSDWEDIHYLAIGFSSDEGFKHIKIKHTTQNEKQEITFSTTDLIYGIQTKWQEDTKALPIKDIRLYVKGTPKPEGSTISCYWAAAWSEEKQTTPSNTPTMELNSRDTPKIKKILKTIRRYITEYDQGIFYRAQVFLETGKFPILGIGSHALNWPLWAKQPDNLEKSGTYLYLWHSLSLARALLAYGHDRKDTSALFAARDVVTSWLDSSYKTAESDLKFTWYDHGTAERLLILVLMHEIGLEYSFDARFMTRLTQAIIEHGNLLENDAFYAAHQPTRYHNHAWFQDLWLIASAQILESLPCSQRWLNKGISRLCNQFNKLITQENGFSVFIENSTGYHHGVRSLVQLAAELSKGTSSEDTFTSFAQGLDAWSSFIRYPDGRSPSNGDSFRKPNPKSPHLPSPPLMKTDFQLLSKAGYAIAKGNHDSISFMLCIFATSVCTTHKHEDDLSLTLFYDGIEWLIDPSYHCYDYNLPEPCFLKSTAAHNMIVIPDHTYELTPGLSQLSGTISGTSFTISGKNQSYTGIKVTRDVSGRLDSGKIHFLDTLDPIQDNALLNLVFGEGVEVSVEGSSLTLTHPASEHKVEIIHRAGSQAWILGELMAGEGFMQLNQVKGCTLQIPDSGKLEWEISLI